MSTEEGHQRNSNATSTVIKINVLRRVIEREIGKKGKRINYLQEQNKVKTTTTIQNTDYQDITITGNQEDIKATIHSISKIILCKNFPTNNRQFGIDCKFEDINNINYTQESNKTQTINTTKNCQANQITTDQLTQIVNHQTTQELIQKTVEAIIRMI